MLSRHAWQANPNRHCGLHARQFTKSQQQNVVPFPY